MGKFSRAPHARPVILRPASKSVTRKRHREITSTLTDNALAAAVSVPIMCDIRTDLFVAPRNGRLSTFLFRGHSRGTPGGVTALSSSMKRPLSWIRSTSGGGWVYNNSVPKAKTEVSVN